jgi:hypothetical protein
VGDGPERLSLERQLRFVPIGLIEQANGIARTLLTTMGWRRQSARHLFGVTAFRDRAQPLANGRIELHALMGVRTSTTRGSMPQRLAYLAGSHLGSRKE